MMAFSLADAIGLSGIKKRPGIPGATVVDKKSKQLFSNYVIFHREKSDINRDFFSGS